MLASAAGVRMDPHLTPLFFLPRLGKEPPMLFFVQDLEIDIN